MIVFIEHPVFTRQITELLTDEQYKDFQTALAVSPHQGDLIPGLGGLRKVRLALPGRGKRGGARVIYLLLLRVETIFLLYAYTKGDIEDMGSEQKRKLRQIVEQIKAEYRP
jgi:hypothetical protein